MANYVLCWCHKVIILSHNKIYCSPWGAFNPLWRWTFFNPVIGGANCEHLFYVLCYLAYSKKCSYRCVQISDCEWGWIKCSILMDKWFQMKNCSRRFSCDVISSQFCKSSYSRPPCWFPRITVRYWKIQPNVPELFIWFISQTKLQPSDKNTSTHTRMKF